jgi:hypothetical protein
MYGQKNIKFVVVYMPYGVGIQTLGVGIQTTLGVGILTTLGMGIQTTLGVGIQTILGVGIQTTLCLMLRRYIVQTDRTK